MKAHLPAIRAQNAGRANGAVVDLGAVSAGAPMDGPGFEVTATAPQAEKAAPRS
ncbi:hypothetical protein [Streptomyces seoulensis]|uniref:hypothetical protein n=1 Tax=Streptomyces seoulensis TaxID=73044 RepID=UPI001FCC414E|nr:hypothetical protein [Streptomyces seoulensis]